MRCKTSFPALRLPEGSQKLIRLVTYIRLLYVEAKRASLYDPCLARSARQLPRR
jgi:hypothetical protein